MKNDIIRVNWPNEKKDYKIVQFVFKDDVYLRFGKTLELHNQDYHKDIIKRFLESEARVDYEMEKGKISQLVPARKGNLYEAVGMGQVIVDPEDKMVIFFGESHDYKVGVDSNHLEELDKLEPEWTFTVNGKPIS